MRGKGSSLFTRRTDPPTKQYLRPTTTYIVRDLHVVERRLVKLNQVWTVRSSIIIIQEHLFSLCGIL